MTEQAITHSVLLAAPKLLGGFFEESVIFILENNADGSFGFVLNRSTKTQLSDLMPDAPEHLQAATVLLGGPVQIDHLFFLALQTDQRASAAIRVVQDLSAFNCLGANPNLQVLPVLGYAGWAPEQLEGEIQGDDWLVTNVDPITLLQVPLSERYAFVRAQLGFDPTLLGQSPGRPQ
jgi:putative transcriptional regulator